MCDHHMCLLQRPSLCCRGTAQLCFPIVVRPLEELLLQVKKVKQVMAAVKERLSAGKLKAHAACTTSSHQHH